MAVVSQDYPADLIDVVIVDDSEESADVRRAREAVQASLGSRLTYVTLHERQTIGAKRNAAVAAAHGEVIATWDDDDTFGCDRLRAQAPPRQGRRRLAGPTKRDRNLCAWRQVAPIAEGRADATVATPAAWHWAAHDAPDAPRVEMSWLPRAAAHGYAALDAECRLGLEV